MKRMLAGVLLAMAGGCLRPALARAEEPLAATPDATEMALTEANEHFVRGDFEAALRVLESACKGSNGAASSSSAQCAFSLGAVHHALGHCAPALHYYRLYQEVAPSGERSLEVKEALEEVAPRCGQVRAETAAPAPPRAPPFESVPVQPPTAERQTPREPPLAVAPPPDNDVLVASMLGLSGAAAVSSVVFGVLAAKSASRCDGTRAYDQAFIDECEVNGPRYQHLWQGFALAAGSFLGIGLTIWWFDTNSETALVVSREGLPSLQYRGSF